MRKSDTRKLILMSLMVAYSLALYLVETIIQNPLIIFFPGAKLGLSNIITLLCLINFRLKDTFKILTVRIILSSLFAGPVSTLLFSIVGGYLSLFGMYIVLKNKFFSKIGVSICGAILHNLGQLLVAGIIIQNLAITSFLPFMLGTSLVTGVFIGIVVNFANPYMEKIIKNRNIVTK